MLFLMNDTVLRLDGVAMDARLAGQRMLRLEFPAILRLGQEMFAREPLLQKTSPERARRLGVDPPLIQQWPSTARYDDKLGVVMAFSDDPFTSF